MDYTQTVNKLRAEFEQFKIVNDRRIREIEQRGTSDPLTQNHLESLNKRLEEFETQLNNISNAMQRPKLEPSGDKISKVDEHPRYTDAFDKYIRKGQEAEITEYTKKRGSAWADAEGGHLVTSRMIDEINKELLLKSQMRQLARITEISADALELLDERGEIKCGWMHDGNTNYNATSDLALIKMVIPVHSVFAQPRITQKTLDDPRIDMEKWINSKLIDAFSHEENKVFLYGDGLGKPKGLLHYTDDPICSYKTRERDVVEGDDLIKILYSLKESYIENCKFMMSRDMVKHLRMLKHDGRYLWQQNFENSGSNRILGIEVVVSSDMPKLEDKKAVIVLADFKSAYNIVDRHDIRLLRDPYTEKPFIKFFATKRVGGDVVNSSALRILSLA